MTNVRNSYCGELVLAATAGLFLLPATGNAAERWETYVNARYAFSICYPADVLTPQGEAENGDGQRFKSSDGAVFSAYGSNYTDYTIKREIDSLSPVSTTYTLSKRNVHVVSGHTGTKIVYIRLIDMNVYRLFLNAEYDVGLKQKYDQVIARMSGCFKAIRRAH